MDEAAETSFLGALGERVDEILESCTRCGKCVTACPMVEPAGLDIGAEGAVRLSSKAFSTCSPAAQARRRRSAGPRSVPTAASASRLAITASTRALWSTWRASQRRRSGARRGPPRRSPVLHDDEPQHPGDFAPAARSRGAGQDQSPAARRGAILRGSGHRVLYRLQCDQDAAHCAARARSSRCPRGLL